MFKYIWIFMLAIAEVLGWIYVIRDLIDQSFKEFNIYDKLDSTKKVFIKLNLVGPFEK